jgi:hypothetical protein
MLLIEPILLTALRVVTFKQQQRLTNATGFFFERHNRLFLVTSRHVVIDQPTGHIPDRVEIEIHIDPDNMAKSTCPSCVAPSRNVDCARLRNVCYAGV